MSFKVKVTFKNVGRNKKTWTAETNVVSEVWLLKQIRESKALASRDISVSVEGKKGIIFAGFRKVGTLSMEDCVPCVG